MLGHRWRRSAFLSGMAVGVACGLAGCGNSRPFSNTAAANPHARVPAASYRSVMPGAATFVPVQPKPWRALPPPTKKGDGQ
mgnify:CR=1 FL=1